MANALNAAYPLTRAHIQREVMAQLAALHDFPARMMNDLVNRQLTALQEDGWIDEAEHAFAVGAPIRICVARRATMVPVLLQ